MTGPTKDFFAKAFKRKKKTQSHAPKSTPTIIKQFADVLSSVNRTIMITLPMRFCRSIPRLIFHCNGAVRFCLNRCFLSWRKIITVVLL